MVCILLCALHTFIELNRKVLGIVRMVGASYLNRSVFQTPNAPSTFDQQSDPVENSAGP